MNDRSFWKYMPAAGPILILLLIGLVLLSAIVYYRAVKIQRFLEPALAVSQPRNEFSKRISGMFHKEFGKKPVPGLEFRMGSIQLDRSLLFSAEGDLKIAGHHILRKLARIFVSLLRDEQARLEISQIIISTHIPVHSTLNDRFQSQVTAGFIQDFIFKSEPDLGKYYAAVFAAATHFAEQQGNGELIEIRIMPSEFVHVEVLERLEKYSY